MLCHCYLVKLVMFMSVFTCFNAESHLVGDPLVVLKSLSIELIQKGLLDNERAKDKALSQEFRSVFGKKERKIVLAAAANKSLSEGFLKIVKEFDLIPPLIEFLKFLKISFGDFNILESNRIDRIIQRFDLAPECALSNVKRTTTDFKPTEFVTTSKLDITANIVDFSQITDLSSLSIYSRSSDSFQVSSQLNAEKPPILPPSNIELVCIKSSMPPLGEKDELVVGIALPIFTLMLKR